MHIFVPRAIHILVGFRHDHLFTNEYFVPNLFSMRFCKTGIFIAPWCLSYHGEFLGVLSSNVLVSPSAQRSVKPEYRGAVNVI